MPLKVIAKSASGTLKPLAIGVGAAALANQIPQNQNPSHIAEKIRDAEKRHHKKGKVKKSLAPVSDDPYFNQDAAQKIFDLVMKMDDDTAQMFCYVVASDLLEQEVEKNRVTLQKHLDEVIAKRADMVMHALVRVAKSADDPKVLAYARALDQISKASTDEDDHIPNFEFERKIRRDPVTGRFQMKVTNRPMGKKPIPAGTWEAMGNEGADKPGYKRGGAGMTKEENQLRYQSQYMQVADFLRAVQASTGGVGNAKVLIHYKNDAGETWADQHTGGKPPAENMLKHGVRVIGVEAAPESLTTGGAAFSLASAMGRNMSPEQVAGINTLSANQVGWTDSWLKAGDATPQNANSRLYNRTEQLGAIAGTLGGPNSKVQLAGALATAVGQYGPQAEAVLGPSARKTAYRYRGTEKTPDARLVSMYTRAIDQNKKLGPLDPWEEQAESKIRRGTETPNTPFGSETGIRPKGTYRRQAKPGEAPSLQQLVAQRQEMADRAPNWRERELGRQAVVQYLAEELPKKDYYRLHLEAGNTPPSEGVIINAKGQIVSQAVGYGDDHYLPFNLKNLKGLKGGEYIRNRSVGGLTAEDVYTGLISGARRVTVVSRSGTFTMEFEPDFRGARRHNDKAARMTRRYEQILDAVQSEQVQRQDVPILWRKVIENEVRGEYGPNASSRLIRAEIDARLTEFKADPKIDGRDLDRAETAISAMEEQEKRGQVSRQDVSNYRKEVMNELASMKEIHFRLNGVGYAAALDSLQEQFPYYIKTASRPKQEHLQELERDLGYVEPARNRPTAAKAGWHGTHRGESMKYSAAHADYQRGLPGTPAPPHPPSDKPRTVSGATDSSSGFSSGGGGARTEREIARDRATEALEQTQSRDRVKQAALGLQQAARSTRPPQNQATPEWWDMDQNQMTAYLDDDKNLKKFDAWVQNVGDLWDNTNASRQWQAYRNAQARTGGGQEYEPNLAGTWLANPYKFTKEARPAYRASPEPGAVEGEIRRLDSVDASLKFDRPLSALSERELREEWELSKNVAAAMNTSKVTGDAAQDALGPQFRNPGSAFVSRFFRDQKGPEQHLENIHRMRYLKSKTGFGGGGGTAGGTAGFGGGGTQPPPAPVPAPTPTPAPTGSEGKLVKAGPDAFENMKTAYLSAADAVDQELVQSGDLETAQQLKDQFTSKVENMNWTGDFSEFNNLYDSLSSDLQTLLTGKVQLGGSRR